MNRKLLLTLSALVIAVAASAQSLSEFSNTGASEFTLSSNNNTLQIAGRAAGFYEQRWLKPGQDNYKHNMFYLKDMDLDLLGTTKNKFTYEIQVNFADLIYAAGTNNTYAPDKAGFKAAYLAWAGPLDVEFGYDKVPYSQGSLNDVYGTPFWSHAILYGGDLFSRRDLGLTLHKEFWKSRINIWGGIYSGMGEYVFQNGDNDPSGAPEYIGRATFSYPAKYKYDEVDEDVSPVPAFRVGVNARYTDKTQSGSNVLPSEPTGAYGIRIIDGQRTAYGGDASVKFKGISAMIEGHMIDMRPSKSTDALYQGTTSSVNNNYVKAAGMCAGLDYNWQRAHSVFAVKYEYINSNDLAPGHEEWFYAGYAYKVNGFRSVLKIEYYKPLVEDAVMDPLKYTTQLRIGYQLIF